MKQFIGKYLVNFPPGLLNIADIGSQDVNGSYRPLFDRPHWHYTGVDMAPGKNVDVVLGNVYDWQELQSASFDVVISGQALEHVEYFWITIMEIRRIMKPGALCCLIAPSAGPEHRYPVDCWRIYPDGFRALARYAGLAVLEVYAQWDPQQHPDRDPQWQDCVLIAKRPE
jgi:SAM-dependent methyltransferase